MQPLWYKRQLFFIQESAIPENGRTVKLRQNGRYLALEGLAKAWDNLRWAIEMSPRTAWKILHFKNWNHLLFIRQKYNSLMLCLQCISYNILPGLKTPSNYLLSTLPVRHWQIIALVQHALTFWQHNYKFVTGNEWVKEYVAVAVLTLCCSFFPFKFWMKVTMKLM